VLSGSGIGPEIMRATLRVLSAVAEVSNLEIELLHGGLVGEEAVNAGEKTLPESVAAFCEKIFREGGAVLSGPAGGRYVYDLRRHFDLFCKLAPVRTWPVLANVSRVKIRNSAELDLLLVRDNCAGVYQGTWSSGRSAQGATAQHSFSYSEEDIRRLARVGVSAAASRRGQVSVIVKQDGVPTITALWQEVAREVAHGSGVRLDFVNIDLAVYQLIQGPELFDVILTPNLFGDVLVDLTAVLQGSRGVTFSGNFNGHGHAVYQTNHGCALDLAGTDRANPAGQILSLAMMLRESFQLEPEARWIELATAKAWKAGWRTADIAEPGCQVLGTQAMADRIAEQVHQQAREAVVQS